MKGVMPVLGLENPEQQNSYELQEAVLSWSVVPTHVYDFLLPLCHGWWIPVFLAFQRVRIVAASVETEIRAQFVQET